MKETDTLFGKYLSGEIGMRESARLLRLLRTHPEQAEKLADLQDVDLILSHASWTLLNNGEALADLHMAGIGDSARAAAMADAVMTDAKAKPSRFRILGADHARRRALRLYGPWLAAASLLLAWGIGLWLSRSGFEMPSAPNVIAHVESVHGAAFRLADDTPDADTWALRVGDEIREGMRIETGEDGAATLAWAADTTAVTLAGDSKLETRAGNRIALQRGRLSASVAPQSGRRPFVVETPNALATVIGTRFELATATGLTRLTVTEGEVELADRAAQRSVRVLAGQGSVVSPPAPPTVFPMGSSEGLLALYLFNAGEGDIVRDVSGVGKPINLTIGNPENTEWTSDGLRVMGAANIRPKRNQEKIRRALIANGALTTEMWLRNHGQTGETRQLYRWEIGPHIVTKNVRFCTIITLRPRQYASSLAEPRHAESVMTGYADGSVLYTRGTGAKGFFSSSIMEENSRFCFVLAPTPDAQDRLEKVKELANVELLIVALYGRELTESELRENHETGLRHYASPAEQQP